MNDFSVCPNCFTVKCEDDCSIPTNERPYFDCGCGPGILISWWRLRLYDPTLPMVPEVGTKYELKPRIITVLDVQVLETSDDEVLRDIYKDISKQEKLLSLVTATATV